MGYLIVLSLTIFNDALTSITVALKQTLTLLLTSILNLHSTYRQAQGLRL